MTRRNVERRLEALEDDTSENVCVAHISAGDHPDRTEWLTREEYIARYDKTPDAFDFDITYEGDR